MLLAGIVDATVRLLFASGIFQGHQFFVIDLDPSQVIAMGLSRREKWNRLLAAISSETRFRKGAIPKRGIVNLLFSRRAAAWIDG